MTGRVLWVVVLSSLVHGRMLYMGNGDEHWWISWACFSTAADVPLWGILRLYYALLPLK